MVGHRRDITGQVFGRLTALHWSDARNGTTFWRFRCECGVEKEISSQTVLQGRVASCGCLHLERCATGANRIRHGDAKKGKVTRLHQIWRGMLKRCSDSYPDYEGGYRSRGIKVCDEWQVYPAFKAWSEANGYRDDLTIDRIDNDLGYSPANCRWADKQMQARNRRTSRHITVDGRTQVLAAWLQESGVTPAAFYARLKRGWTEQQAVAPKR